MNGLLNLCVWAKNNPGKGSPYRDQHELICVFKAGAEMHNLELGRHDRNRSNLWTCREPNAFDRERDAPLASEPIVRPVSLIADALRDVTKRGDIVIHSFLGSGSTLIAAEETGLTCFGVEIDPIYIDVAIRRWQMRTACDAVHVVTGEAFNERARQRAPAGFEANRA